MAGQNQELCESYINCSPKDEVPILVLTPCISTENVAITQNRTQQTACRGNSSQVENVESTSFSGTSQIELIDDESRLIADIIHRKSKNCQEIQMFYLEAIGPRTTDPVSGEAIPLWQDLNIVTGDVICGVPDSTRTRDQSAKNLSFTVSPTNGAAPPQCYIDWIEEVIDNNQFPVEGDPSDLIPLV